MAGKNVVGLAAVAALSGLFCWPGMTVGEELPDQNAAVGWNSSISDTELARQSGFGIGINGEDNTVVVGDRSSAAHASSKVTLNGAVEAETVTAGDISAVTVSSAQGMNVFQNNTAPNVNQIVTQAIIIQFLDAPQR